MQEDFDNVKACEAYRKNDGRCRINNLICTDGDCRTCNFVIDGSMMITLENVCQRMDMMLHHMGVEPHECGCGCDCGCGSEE